MVKIKHLLQSFSIVTLFILGCTQIPIPVTDNATAAADHDPIIANYRAAADKIIAAALSDSSAYDRLALIVTDV